MVIGLIYYKYFYYTISDQISTPLFNQEVLPTQTQVQTQTKTSMQDQITETICKQIPQEINYESVSELKEQGTNTESCNNLLNRYIDINEYNNENDISIVNNPKTEIDNLINSNNLGIEYPQETNIGCKQVTNIVCPSPNQDIVNRYIQSNSNCDNFESVNNQNIQIDNQQTISNEQNQNEYFNINQDLLGSSNIIKAITRLNNSQSNSNQIETFNSNPNSNSNPIEKTSRIIWIYWENINRNKHPTYIKLCLDTMKKHLGTKYKLIFLNEKTIKNYLPNLRDDFSNLKIAQKVDYYRIALLHKYGGIWIDADIIVMRDFDPIFEKLDEGYDYVGFGCTGWECSYGYFRPSNWVMGSRKNSILMAKCLEKLNKKLDMRNTNQVQDDSTYHDYGKIILWDSLDELKPFGYNYYHFTSEHDGARDKNKNWIHIDNFFSTNKTEFLNESKLFFVVLYNSEISSDSKYKWVYDCDESRLLYGNEWICSLYRKSLDIQ